MIGQYARANRAIAILGRDSDFFIFNSSAGYWALNFFDSRNFHVTPYPANALSTALGFPAVLQPLFAALSTNDFIAPRSFHTHVLQRFWASLSQMAEDEKDEDLLKEVAVGPIELAHKQNGSLLALHAVALFLCEFCGTIKGELTNDRVRMLCEKAGATGTDNFSADEWRLIEVDLVNLKLPCWGEYVTAMSDDEKGCSDDDEDDEDEREPLIEHVRRALRKYWINEVTAAQFEIPAPRRDVLQVSFEPEHADRLARPAMQRVLLELRRCTLSSSFHNIVFQGLRYLPPTLADHHQQQMNTHFKPFRQRNYGLLTAAGDESGASCVVLEEDVDGAEEVQATVVNSDLCNIDVTFAKDVSKEIRLSAFFNVLLSGHAAYKRDKVVPHLTARAEFELMTLLKPVPERHWLFLSALMLLDQAVMLDNQRLVNASAEESRRPRGKPTQKLEQDVCSFRAATFPDAIHALLFAYVHSLCVRNEQSTILRTRNMELHELAASTAFSLACDHVLSAHALCNFPLAVDLSLTVAVDADAYYFGLYLIASCPDLSRMIRQLSRYELRPAFQKSETPGQLFDQLRKTFYGLQSTFNEKPLRTPNAQGTGLITVSMRPPVAAVAPSNHRQQQGGRHSPDWGDFNYFESEFDEKLHVADDYGDEYDRDEERKKKKQSWKSGLDDQARAVKRDNQKKKKDKRR